jgi:hypothetical protein
VAIIPVRNACSQTPLRNDSDLLFTAKTASFWPVAHSAELRLPLSRDPGGRAQLLHTLALTAIKQNDITIGGGLLLRGSHRHASTALETAIASPLRARSRQRDKLVVLHLPDVWSAVTQSIAFLIIPLCLYGVERSTGDENPPTLID